jgi:hypothetical protein
MNRPFLALSAFALSASVASACPIESVPDSASSAGMLVLSMLGIAVLRRSLSK